MKTSPLQIIPGTQFESTRGNGKYYGLDSPIRIFNILFISSIVGALSSANLLPLDQPTTDLLPRDR